MIYTVSSGAELQKVVREADIYNTSVIKVDTDTGSIDVPGPVTFPKKLKALGKQLEIDLQGHKVNFTGPGEYGFGRENPIDATEANNVMQSQAFSIVSGFIDGKGLIGSGILNRCSFGDVYDRVEVSGVLKNGIVLEFGMNARIVDCYTRAIPGIGIGLLSGTFPGAGFNKSGSNNSRVIQSRSFPLNGQTACFSSERSGSTVFDGCIVDAARNQVPKIGFKVDNSGSTTCKNNTFLNSWAESLCSEAMFDLNLSGGFTKIEGTFPQYGGVLVKAIGTNYSELYLNLTGNIPGSAKFSTIPNGVIWTFRDNPSGYDFKNPANWIGGILPVKYSIERFGPTKEREIVVPGAFKLNGSPIITRTELDKILEGYVKK